MYRAVLLPTDGSDSSLHALDHALDIANAYDATLHALFVVDTSYPFTGFDDGTIDPEPLFEALREEGERTLQRVEERAERTATPFVGALREAGVVHRAILEYVDENDIDVIVMGTHGRRGLDRWLLGSVTERTVRTADVPVLTVRGPMDADE